MQVGEVQGVQGALPPARGWNPHPPYFTQVGTAIDPFGH